MDTPCSPAWQGRAQAARRAQQSVHLAAARAGPSAGPRTPLQSLHQARSPRCLLRHLAVPGLHHSPRRSPRSPSSPACPAALALQLVQHRSQVRAGPHAPSCLAQRRQAGPVPARRGLCAGRPTCSAPAPAGCPRHRSRRCCCSWQHRRHPALALRDMWMLAPRWQAVRVAQAGRCRPRRCRCWRRRSRALQGLPAPLSRW